MESEEEQKHELERLLRESKRKSKEISRRAGEYMQYGQHMTDLAGAGEHVINCILPSGVDWQPKIEAWRYANEQQDEVLNKMGAVSVSALTSTGSVVAYEMDQFADPNTVIVFSGQSRQDEVRKTSIELSHVIDRFAEKEKILELLQRYGLSASSHERKSPAELFETA